MSSFIFNLTSVTCRELYRGPSIFRMSDWLGLDANGFIKDQNHLVSRLISAEKLEIVERPMEEQQQQMQSFYARSNFYNTHRSTRYDTILFGSLNDGTSIAIHVTDFCPWVVFQFDNSETSDGVVYDPDFETTGTLDADVCGKHENEIRDVMESIKRNNPAQLGQISFEIQARACSDGVLPSKRNPYIERKYNYVYVYTPDASYASRMALMDAMKQHGAHPVEDTALNESVRFLQATKLCPTEWYTLINWQEVTHGFVACDQLEITCTMADIIRMINPPSGIVLPPHTECFWDIEHHKFESGEEPASRDFASPDDPLNNIICINVAIWRTGVFDSISDADTCRRNMPRMDDEDVNLLSYTDANPTNLDGTPCYVNVPDPLDVEQSGKSMPAKSREAIDELEGAGQNVESDNIFDAALNTDIFPPLQDFVPEDLELEDVIRAIGKNVQISNLAEQDLDDLDNIQATVEALKTPEYQKLKPTLFNPNNSFNGSSMDVDLPEIAKIVDRESKASMDARHGYEIPQWAIEKLGARVDLKAKNELMDELKRVQTPILLNNSRYIRRISFFVDPSLNCNYKRFLLKPLYQDDSDGVLVHAYRSEAAALVAFRDFMISVHPEMTCGHFTRSYDWKTLFTRANCMLNDCIPVRNSTRDSPIAEEKLMKFLPILEHGSMLSTPDNPFPVSRVQEYYDAVSTNVGPHYIVQDAKLRQTNGKQLTQKSSRTSCFAFMNRLLFSPVQLVRKITRSANTVAVESVCPVFDGFADIDSLVSIRLALPTLQKFKLNYLSESFLKDAKMDIGIPRMNAAYRQKQYWAVIAYCDYDCVLVGALMTALRLRGSHASLSRCCHLSMHDIPNYGQQKRIFVKNAVVAHYTNLVLVRCSIACPELFGGGHVGTPNGGIYPVPANCLDYVSFYVSIMMTHNLCFTAYKIPWDKNFDPIIFDPYDGVAAFKAYRTFQRNLRRVYGPPDYRKRPNALPYYTCKKCGSEDFELVPDMIDEASLASLPSHEMLQNDKSLALQYVANHPERCKTCSAKPWVKDTEPAYDTSLIPDISSPLDPYRELRYAIDFDYLVPRSSMVSFQSDPEAYDMYDVKRYRPGSKTQYVMEDSIVEHEAFDFIDDDTWARQRYQRGYAAFLKALKDKKKGKKKDQANIRYVPSIASFVLWRPGDFDNQAKSLYVKKQLACDKHFDAKSLPLDEAEDTMLKTVGNCVWDVDGFEAYANQTAVVADQERIKAFRSRRVFDRSRFDIRSRRGIVKFGSTTGSVQELFLSRKETTALQKKIIGDPKWYDTKLKKWLDGVQRTIWEGLQGQQLGQKGAANSFFGASGTKTGSIKNTFVAAAITFMSRNMIYFTSYVTLTRWCPSMSLYEKICKFRLEALKKKDQMVGVSKKYMERYILRAPFPKHPDAGRQVWLKPVCSAYQLKNMLMESLWGIIIAYGDTDSIFACLAALVLGSPDDVLNRLDAERRELAIEIGKSMAHFVTQHFRTCSLKWMTIEFEKMMYPFFLFHGVKKRYIGGHWEEADKMMKITKKSFGIKRDMPKILQKLVEMVIKVLVETVSGESIDALFRDYLTKMMERGGEIIDFERDVAAYSKSQAYNKSDYVSLACHVEANNRLAEAFPGHEHSLGDRIEYVICYDPSRPEIAKRSWTLTHIKLLMEERDAAVKMGKPPPRQITELRIDIPYYIEQCMSILCDVYTITKPPKQIYERPCTFAEPGSSLQRLVADSRWKNMILPTSPNVIDEHIAHYEKVLSGSNDCFEDQLCLEMRDLSLCKPTNTAASKQSLMYLMSSDGGSLGVAPGKKKDSPLARSIIDHFVAKARTKVSQTLSKTSIGIHSFFTESLNPEEKQKMFEQFELDRLKAAEKAAEAARLKKRQAEMAPPAPISKRKAPQPKNSGQPITKFFASPSKKAHYPQ